MPLPRFRMHPSGMPRKKRQYLPGTAFHITSRVQWKEQHFDEPLRTEIVAAVRDSLYKSDARIIALAVMPNHLHLVVRQGLEPLASLMQPLLTRAALRTRRATRQHDHVFGGRYFSKPCGNATYLRELIAYTHLNPVRWGLCSKPEDYAWSSASAYLDLECKNTCGMDIPFVGRNLFAGDAMTSDDTIMLNYQNYMCWRLTCDAQPEIDFSTFLQDFHGGDNYWSEHFATICPEPSEVDSSRFDLRDIALTILARQFPGISLEDFIFAGGRHATLVRREIVKQALRAGFKGTTIARFLRVSETTISKIRSVRPAALEA